MSWKPTVKHGFKELIGSWKIIAMSLPISRRRWRGLRPRRSRPWNASRSAVILAVQGKRPMTASMETLLPDPLSPTMPRLSPAMRSKLTPSTAFTSAFAPRLSRLLRGW